jgi:peptidoglycan hydrolase-like protein with peptidoglycan-binding domain
MTAGHGTRVRQLALSAAAVAVLSGCGGGAAHLTSTGSRSTLSATVASTSARTPSTTRTTLPAVAGEPVARKPAATRHRAVKPASSARLQAGSYGPAVRALQRTLVRLTSLSPDAVDGSFGLRTWDAVVAFQGWSGLTRDGVAGAQTKAALRHAQAPRPWSPDTGIEVHIPQQVLLLVDHGRVQRAIHVSTGRPGYDTPTGHFAIQSRSQMSWSRPFHAWLPLAQYFVGGDALHEYADVPAYPASHGCVRMPSDDAPPVWGFGRIGMRVWTSA